MLFGSCQTESDFSSNRKSSGYTGTVYPEKAFTFNILDKFIQSLFENI